MTLEEINSLTLDDVRTIVTTRVIGKYGDALDEKPALLDDLIDKEFEVYIDELRDAEESRLADEAEAERAAQEEAAEIVRQVEKERIDSLKERVKAVDRRAFHELHSEPNMAVWVRDNIISNQDHADAEVKLAELEAKDVEVKASPEAVKGKWKKDLYKAIADNDLSVDGFVEALMRKEILGDSSLLDGMRDKLVQINTDHPRPQE